MIKVRIEGMDRLKRMADNLRIPSSAITQTMATVMRTAVLQHFRDGMGPDGPWEASRRAEEQGGKTLQDTNRLRQSIERQSTDREAIVGTNLAYGAIHQFGGVIVPKKGRALAIPVSAEARSVGKPSLFPRKLSLEWPKGARSGRLVERNKLDEELVHFVLVRSVTIPERPYLWLSPADREEIRKAVMGMIQDRMKQGG